MGPEFAPLHLSVKKKKKKLYILSGNVLALQDETGHLMSGIDTTRTAVSLFTAASVRVMVLLQVLMSALV